jgi:hypothetical protein
MINKILRKAKSPSQKRNPYSYTERGKEKKKWAKGRKEVIDEMKRELEELIRTYIKREPSNRIHDTDKKEGKG